MNLRMGVKENQTEKKIRIGQYSIYKVMFPEQEFQKDNTQSTLSQNKTMARFVKNGRSINWSKRCI
ncbi:hypothetical protein RhiirC2_761645 [Rhizophagus irregularis]|uniref:Uncharacterized protein n=1 Tax=Rhizophagus irregularis TaxID=588596 RepID=A0A2N1MG24_9GLOM|nr:hypothetical protein RhiirC2_761645 [Rhizophagus irregularis]